MLRFEQLQTVSYIARNHAGRYRVEEKSDIASVVAHSNSEHNLTLRVVPDFGKGSLAYFLLYNNCIYTKATQTARISLVLPAYIKPSDWTLNCDDCNRLMQVLRSANTLTLADYPLSVWESLIIFYNSERIGLPFELSLQITRANRAKFIERYDKEFDELYLALPIDLSMPDYTKLKE